MCGADHVQLTNFLEGCPWFLGRRAGYIHSHSGIGGLGSLGIQYAKKLGFRVIALSGSSSKHDFSKSLGANAFFDASSVPSTDLISKIMELTHGEGISVLMATAPSNSALTSLLPAMTFKGTVLILAAFPEPLLINPGLLLMKNLCIQGFTAGSAKDNDKCLNFSGGFDVKPVVERFNPEEIATAYERMITGKVRFRSVICFSPQ